MGLRVEKVGGGVVVEDEVGEVVVGG